MTSESTLVSDQVFQLNTLLWALEELPEQSRIQPVLRNAGYSLLAIGRRLLMPVDDLSLSAIRRLTGSNDTSACRPDLWLKHSGDLVQPLVELKSRGFSPASSNRRQALKLLVAAFDLGPSLGEPNEHRGHVVYGTVSSDADDMVTTLDQLADKTRAEGVPVAPNAVIALSIENEGVALSSPRPEDLPEPAAEALSSPAIVLERDDDNDLRPLYFVPWIPDIGGSQDETLRADGYRELTARVLTQAMGYIGQSRVPNTLLLTGTQLLSGATLGVFNRWQEENKRQFSEAAAKIVERRLRSHVGIIRKRRDHIEIDLPDVEAQNNAIDRLDRAEPANQSTNFESVIKEQPTLFDTDLPDLP